MDDIGGWPPLDVIESAVDVSGEKGSTRIKSILCCNAISVQCHIVIRTGCMFQPVFSLVERPAGARITVRLDRVHGGRPAEACKSSREIARILNDRNVATPTGKPWSAMTVIRAHKRLAT